MKDKIWCICMKWGIVNQHWSDGDRERLTQEIADALTAEDEKGYDEGYVEGYHHGVEAEYKRLTAEDENQAAKRLIEEYEEEEGGCSIYLLDFIDWLDRRE